MKMQQTPRSFDESLAYVMLGAFPSDSNMAYDRARQEQSPVDPSIQVHAPQCLCERLKYRFDHVCHLLQRMHVSYC